MMRSRSSLLGILFVAVVISACDQNTSDSQTLDPTPDGISALEALPTPATQDGSKTQLAGVLANDATDSPRVAADVEIRRATNSDRDGYYDAIRRAKAR
jgi:uncharacterized lipoprotein